MPDDAHGPHLTLHELDLIAARETVRRELLDEVAIYLDALGVSLTRAQEAARPDSPEWLHLHDAAYAHQQVLAVLETRSTAAEVLP